MIRMKRRKSQKKTTWNEGAEAYIRQLEHMREKLSLNYYLYKY